MSFRSRLEEVARLQEQLRLQEAELEAERTASLAALPARFGFVDTDEFIREIRRANRKTGVATTGKASRKTRRVAPLAVADSVPVSVVESEAIAPRGLARAQEETKEPAPAALPTGTSLDDPTNFGQLPDFGLLRDGASIDPETRARVVGALAFANRVLHTSRVPAAVWREWRRFEKDASELLRQP